MVRKAANHYNCTLHFSDGSRRHGKFIALTPKLAEEKAKRRYEKVRSVRCRITTSW